MSQLPRMNGFDVNSKASSRDRPRLQTVIVQGTLEEARVIAALANLKHRRHLPYGGATASRWLKGEID